MPTFNNLDDLMKAIKKKTEEATGNVPIDQLLHEGFMKSHTKFNNVQEFFDAFPVKFKTQEEWDSLDNEQKDLFVKENTDFETWNDMFKAAGVEHFKKHFNS